MSFECFLQFIEQDSSESIIIGSTNNINILDSALFRRFDDIITYSVPEEKEIERLIKIKLGNYLAKSSLKKNKRSHRIKSCRNY